MVTFVAVEDRGLRAFPAHDAPAHGARPQPGGALPADQAGARAASPPDFSHVTAVECEEFVLLLGRDDPFLVSPLLVRLRPDEPSPYPNLRGPADERSRNHVRVFPVIHGFSPLFAGGRSIRSPSGRPSAARRPGGRGSRRGGSCTACRRNRAGRRGGAGARAARRAR